MTTPFANPKTGEPLEVDGARLVGTSTGTQAGTVVDGIPRFVNDHANYAEDNFGWQWKRWNTLGGSPEALHAKARLIADRSGFTPAMLDGKTLLECGAGRGDDTLILLDYPLAEVHTFDLTTAIEVAYDVISDARVTFSQASILDIPYPDRHFDVVFCHRVLQHTPDPPGALRSICRKVKPGGLLFAHTYKRSIRAMNQYKYKYRPLTKRMSNERIASLLDRHGEQLYRIHERTADANRALVHLLIGLVPLARIKPYGDLDRDGLIELSKLATFDALTPTYDRPMTARKFRTTIESEGFEVEKIENDPTATHLCIRARRT